MTVIEQLSEYCDCLTEVNEKDVDELIHLISVYTCWTGKVCDTFLSAERKEVINLPPRDRHYHPVLIFSFYLFCCPLR